MNYIIKNSRKGPPIVQVQDVHLHSVYDPQKEATQFVQKNRDLILAKEDLLILGAGFGHHIQECMNLLQEERPNVLPRVVVIEPHREIFNEARSRGLLPGEHISYYAGHNIEDLYRDQELVFFLIQHPSILVHPASFNLYREYFTEFLTFRSKLDLNDELQNLTSFHMSEYLSKKRSYNEKAHLLSTLKHIEHQKEDWNEEDFLLLSFLEIAKMAKIEKSKQAEGGKSL